MFIAVYTCASSTAIRLDTVPDASCSSFIRSLKQCISINSVFDLYISIIAKCFTGRVLKDYLSALSSSLRYILEVPDGGECFRNERVVEALKRCLRKILPKSKLTYEKLVTVFCEIESVVNSRPLSLCEKCLYSVLFCCIFPQSY